MHTTTFCLIQCMFFFFKFSFQLCWCSTVETQPGCALPAQCGGTHYEQLDELPLLPGHTVTNMNSGVLPHNTIMPKNWRSYSLIHFPISLRRSSWTFGVNRCVILCSPLSLLVRISNPACFHLWLCLTSINRNLLKIKIMLINFLKYVIMVAVELLQWSVLFFRSLLH